MRVAAIQTVVVRHDGAGFERRNTTFFAPWLSFDGLPNPTNQWDEVGMT
jgi:hypothetical protein